MNFSSLFFTLIFLPLFALVYYRHSNTAYQNRVLLLFSLIFYCWGGVRYVLLLLLMSAVGWYCGKRIQQEQNERLRKYWLTGAVAVFLGVLGFFKCISFVSGSLPADSPFLRLTLPLGISFYTFKLISYVADIYHDRIQAEDSYFDVLTYTAMFFNISQGPIVRYQTIADEMHTRKRRLYEIADGIHRCCLGLFKKVLFADHCGSLAEQFLPLSDSISSVPASGVWLGSLCYMLQIYLDFSAYSDIAIGLGRIFGFHFEENFNYPYMAVSVKDFWKRWHISLSSFFRDYVYIPLGGSRVSEKRTMINLLIVWALTGFWHGASWNFILWGLFFFAFIMLENTLKKKNIPELPTPVMRLITLFIVFISWILFRFENFSQLGSALAGLIGLHRNVSGGSAIGITFANNIFFLIAAVLACTPLFRALMKWIRLMFKRHTNTLKGYYIFQLVLSVLFFAISFILMIGSSYSPFLYNQF